MADYFRKKNMCLQSAQHSLFPGATWHHLPCRLILVNATGTTICAASLVPGPSVVFPHMWPAPTLSACTSNFPHLPVRPQLAKDYLTLQTEVTLLNTKKKQLEERLHRTAGERHSRDTPKYASDLVKLQQENVSRRWRDSLCVSRLLESGSREPGPRG